MCSKKGDVTYYVCSEVKNGCKARAIVRTVSVTSEDGEQYEAKQLTAVSTPQVSFSNFGIIQMLKAFL